METDLEEKLVCVLCGEEIDGYGHNPQPLADTGRCCSDCNATRVIKTRIENYKRYMEHEKIQD